MAVGSAILRAKRYAARRAMEFNPNHLAPCPIIDNPQALRDIVAESGARPTHPGAESVLQGPIAAYLDRLSREWRERAEGVRRRLGLGDADVAACEVAVPEFAHGGEAGQEEGQVVAVGHRVEGPGS